MELNLEQRVCIKFCVKNGFNGATTLQMLEKCFGNDTLKKTVVYQWHERFRSGRESVNDDERSGRPSTSKTDENINKIKEWMTVHRKLTIREMAEALEISFGSVQDILVNDLGLRSVAAKLVPKDLNFIQKRDRVDVAKDMISKAQQDDHLCNKCCNDVINAFDSKQTLSQYGLPDPKLLRSDDAIVKDDVDQGDQSEKPAFSNVPDVKIEPKSEGLEQDVEDIKEGTTGINYDPMLTMPGLESKVKQQGGTDGKRENNSATLTETFSSSRTCEDDITLTTLDSKYKREINGEYFKREKSVDIDDRSDEGKPNDETEDDRGNFSLKYIGSLPNNTDFRTGNWVTNKKPYVCCECGKSFSRPSKLKIHEWIHITGEKPYKCCDCKKGFITTYDLKIHERTHTGEKPYKCHECGKCFIRLVHLKVHERIHTGEKPYQCCECEKSFITLDKLKLHERTHTGEKPYKCSECNKCFITNSELKIHESIHTGKKPHKCCKCEKAFITTRRLKVHERSHTIERTFNCSECGKSFINKAALKSHERMHTGEKPHKCCECQKGFFTEHGLKIHERIHVGEKRYNCCKCDKDFISSAQLKVHERNDHILV